MSKVTFIIEYSRHIFTTLVIIVCFSACVCVRQVAKLEHLSRTGNRVTVHKRNARKNHSSDNEGFENHGAFIAAKLLSDGSLNDGKVFTMSIELSLFV